jgi:predicted nucleic acid-binding protein
MNERKMKVYLDNCCYNRPFDDLSQEKIRNEAAAKMFIQSLIKFKCLSLYYSYMSLYEINGNPFTTIRDHIFNFIKEYASVYISDKRIGEIEVLSNEIMLTGIKKKDAVHLACSIIAECSYFITTDKQVLNFQTDKIRILNPVDFAEIWRKIL